MSALLRFAPSPTGYVHIGNGRMALLNVLLARQLGGDFLLRIDDTDTERSEDKYVEALREDLHWLGVGWSREEVQSRRLEKYSEALERLKAGGRAYPCYDSPEELSLMRKAALSAGRPPIYDRSALDLSASDRATLEARGVQPHWRFRLDHDKPILWDDRVRGRVEFQPDTISDPVLFRADGRALYTVTSVVDDAEMGISHVLRGEDHVTNTATQIQLFEALGASVPEFAHLPLLLGADGKPLSKRHGDFSVRGLRGLGLESESVVSFMVALGTSFAAEPIDGLDDLLEGFDLGHYGKSAPRFEDEALRSLNARQIHSRQVEDVRERLDGLGVPAGDQGRFWATFSGNVGVFPDLADWWQIVDGSPEPGGTFSDEDRAFCGEAAGLMAADVVEPEGYREWIGRVKAATGRKGRGLFMPIRLALSGRGDGPELDQLTGLIGFAKARQRLVDAAS